MLTAQMDVEDVVHEIMTDVRWLETYLTMQTKVVMKELRKLGTIPATVVKQAKSPKTQNEWTILHTIEKGKALVPATVYYTTLQDEDGVYIYAPRMTQDEIYVVVLQPHVFRRYRERLNLGDKLKTPQLIRHHMKKNLNGHFMPAGQHQDEPSWALCIEEGVVLGNFVGEQLFFGRTFITYDMAHEGLQADTFSEGDEKRRQLKTQVVSSRDVVKHSYEAESITMNKMCQGTGE